MLGTCLIPEIICLLVASVGLAWTPATTEAGDGGNRGSDNEGATQMTERMICREVTVTASLEEVWRAWTTSAGAEAFFAPKVNIELAIGGRYEVYFDLEAPEGSRGSEGCKVLSYLPMDMLSFSWNAPPDFPDVRRQRTTVVLLFDDLGDGRVRVRMSHFGWRQGRQWDQTYAYFQRAWGKVLGSFERRFRHDAPTAKQESAGPKPHFLVLLQPSRPTLLEDMTDQEQRIFQEHGRWLAKLVEDGIVLLAGPCLDGQMGIVILEALGEEAARAIMAEDPAVQAGLFSTDVHPFRVSLMCGRRGRN